MPYYEDDPLLGGFSDDITDELLEGQRGRGARFLDPLDTRSSGRVTFTADECSAIQNGTGETGPFKQLLSAQRPPHERGLASVYVSETRDPGANPAGSDGADGIRNIVPEVEVTWSDGFAGGLAFVDITQGKTFTVPGVQSIALRVRFRSGVSGDDLSFNGVRDYTYEAVVQWHSSISPKPAYWTSPRIALTAGVFSANGSLLVPKYATSFIVLPTEPLAIITARLKRGFGTGAAPNEGTVCIIRDAFANSVPVVAGANYLDLQSNIDCNATVVWEIGL